MSGMMEALEVMGRHKEHSHTIISIAMKVWGIFVRTHAIHNDVQGHT